MKNIVIASILMIIFASACDYNNHRADAYGNFEASDQLVSPEISGKILEFTVEEGVQLQKGQQVAIIDTTQFYLKKLQLYASINAIKSQLQDPGPQIDILKKKILVLNKEKDRVISLIKDDAGTQKQLDDIQGQLDILEQQIISTKEQSLIANRAMMGQIAPIESQILQLEDQINRCFVKNPVDGTVLLKFSEADEIASPLKALYKIADLSSLELRAYVNGEQLPNIAIGREVWVEIDRDSKSNERLGGKVSWIAERAEFTPKTIQTKEERVNMVYAFKVKVDNPDGKIKIGMPGEVYFDKSNVEE